MANKGGKLLKVNCPHLKILKKSYQRIVPLKAIIKGGILEAEIKQFVQNIIYCNFKGQNALFI